MKLNTILGSVLFLLLIIGIVQIPYVHSDEATTVCTSPKWGQSLIGQSHVINITVANVTDLRNWQLELHFNPTILNCTQILDPTTDPNNIFAYRTDVMWFEPKINNTKGTIRAFCGLWLVQGVNGSGNLCQINFTNMALGVSNLNFIVGEDATYLRDSKNVIIPFEVINGIADVIAPDFDSYTFDVTQDGQTYHVDIVSNSTVTSFDFNQSSKEMSFNVYGPDGTIGYCRVAIPKQLLNDTLTILIDNKASRHLSKSFNILSDNATHCYPYFMYSHSTRTVKIKETVPGDITGDRKTDIRDVAMVARAFGANHVTDPASPKYCQYWHSTPCVLCPHNPICDLTGPQDVPDGKVDIRDVAMVALNFGNVY